MVACRGVQGAARVVGQQAALRQGGQGAGRAGGGAGRVHERGGVQEAGANHALGPLGGRVVQRFVREPPGGRSGVAPVPAAGAPRRVQHVQQEVGAVCVGGVLVAEEFLGGLRHERALPVGGGQCREVVGVGLVQQVAQRAGAADGAQQAREGGRVVVGLAVGAQPGGTVRFLQRGFGLGPDLCVQVRPRGGVGEQAPDGVGAAALPHAHQGVALRRPAHAPAQGPGDESGVAAGQERGVPGGGDVGPGGQQFGAQPLVQRHAVQPVGDRAAQRGGAAGVAVDGGVDGRVVGGHQLLEDARVQSGVRGQGGAAAAVAVPGDGGGEGWAGEGAACEQFAHGGVGQGPQGCGRLLGCGVLQQQGQGGRHAPRREGRRAVGRFRRRLRFRGEEFGQGAAVGRQRVVQPAPAGRVGARVAGGQFAQPCGRQAVRPHFLAEQGGQRAGGAGAFQQGEDEVVVERAGLPRGGGERPQPRGARRGEGRAQRPGRGRGAAVGTAAAASGPGPGRGPRKPLAAQPLAQPRQFPGRYARHQQGQHVPLRPLVPRHRAPHPVRPRTVRRTGSHHMTLTMPRGGGRAPAPAGRRTPVSVPGGRGRGQMWAPPSTRRSTPVRWPASEEAA